MSSYTRFTNDLEARKLVMERWPQKPAEKPAERWVQCMACCTWKKIEPGNHHPWCGCGSDLFQWGDERDRNPEEPR